MAPPKDKLDNSAMITHRSRSGISRIERRVHHGRPVTEGKADERRVEW